MLNNVCDTSINICDNRDDIDSDCYRENDHGHDSHKITSDKPDVTNTDSTNINIYRYKFKETFTKELYRFSKIHQYDHRKDFKESWNIWVEDNDEIVSEEVTRLTNLGYNGNVLDKMFKSGRYYFRKKSTEKKEPRERRKYNGVQKEFLDSMDKHIETNIKSTDYKPSDGFELYCNINTDLLKEEIKRLMEGGITDMKEIQAKIKKTYKNRYFLFINKK